MNINTSSTYTYGSSASKGMSGLASGLDTESLVKEMLSGTQSKIDAQEALKQQTEWKQEIYRDLIDQINTFQKSYFSASSATSLSNSAFYNTMAASTSSANFKVTASSTAAAGSTSLEVHQLASSYTMSSSSPVSGTLSGTFDTAALQSLLDAQRTADRTLAFNVGGSGTTGSTEVKIDLNSYFKNTDGSLNASPDSAAIANAIQSALKDQAGLSATVTISGGQLSIVSKDAERSLAVSGNSTKEALSALGLTTSSEARANVGKTQRSLTSKVSLAPTLDFAVSLDDGLQKTVRMDVTRLMDASGKLDTAKVKDVLSDALDAQFGKGTIQVTKDAGNGLSISTPVAGRKLVVYSGSNKETLAALGLRNGQSNRISLYDTLKQMPASTPLQGSEFEFEINGVQFRFTENDDIDMVMRTVNASEAGVTMTYKPLDDAFVITSNNSGSGYDIQMSQTKGNLLNVMLGGGADGKLAAGNTAVSAPWTSGGKLASSKTYLPEDEEGKSTLRKGSFALTVNGKDYTITLPERDKDEEGYTLEKLIDELNKELEKTFGTTPDEDNMDVKAIQLEAAGDGVRFVVKNGASVSLAATKGADLNDAEKLTELAAGGNLAVALGFVSKDGMDNLVSGSTTLEQVELGDWAEALGISRTTTLDGLAEATKELQNGLRLSFADGKLTVTATDPEHPDAANFKIGNDEQTRLLFGAPGFSLGGASSQPRAIVSEGRNAVVRIDGALTERSSNVFTYNGLTVELTGVSPLAEGGGTTAGCMKYVDENGIERTWSSTNQRWVDAAGYERAVDDQYVVFNPATGAAKRVSSLDDDPGEGFQFVRYTNATFYAVDEDGNLGARMPGAGLKDSVLVNSSGQPMQARKTETITVTRDTDKIVEGVKGFIDEYNKLVKTINDLLNEEASYRDYSPLTDEQRQEMSDKQIELWEEKAKQGLLRRDTILDGFLRDMRSIWYETNSSGYAIYQLGIETGEWSTRGQLTLGQDGEATLRQMLASDPSGVMSFFANSVDGAAVRVNEIIKQVANTSSGSPGSLVELAGIKGMATEKNNTLYNKIKQIDEKIERLKNQYKQEKDRYWDQFNSMESYIQNMNSQSSYLASMFSY